MISSSAWRRRRADPRAGLPRAPWRARRRGPGRWRTGPSSPGGSPRGRAPARCVLPNLAAPATGPLRRWRSAGRELADLLGVERRLSREVEALEVAHEGEVRDFPRHLDPPLVAGATSRSHTKASASRSVISRRAASSSKLSSWSPDHGQPQPAEHPNKRLVVDHRHQPPPMARSYSASGRRRSGSVPVSAQVPVGLLAGRRKPGTPWCAGSTSR